MAVAMANERPPTKRPAEVASVDERAPKQRWYLHILVTSIGIVLTSSSVEPDYDDTILILVGEEEKRFTVHKDVICVKSKFFRVACSNRWQEGQKKVMRLPQIRSIQAFQKSMNWTYTMKLNPGLPSDVTTCYEYLIELYILGDILDDMKLRNRTLHLLNELLWKNTALLCPELCQLVWEHTPSTSPLRKWTVDAYVTLFGQNILKQHGSSYPADFVLQVAIKAMGLMKDEVTDKAGMYERMKTYMESEDKA